MNLIVFIHNRKNCSESIVGGIQFHNKLSIKNLVYKNRSGDEHLLYEVESIMVKVVKLLEDVFLDKID